MSKRRKSFVLHIDSLDILDELSNEQAGLLFKAIKSYQRGEELNLCTLTKIAFSPFKNQFIRDGDKYENTCKARAAAGSKGGKQKVANASNCKQKVANVADSDNKSKSDSKSNKDSDLLKDSLSGKPDVRLVIDHFNSVTGQKLKASTKSHSENISGRLSDGYTVEDLNLVIDFKNSEWSSDPKFAQYIRPSTLFQAGKFGGYLSAAKTAPKVKKSSLHNLSGITYKSEEL